MIFLSTCFYPSSDKPFVITKDGMNFFGQFASEKEAKQFFEELPEIVPTIEAGKETEVAKKDLSIQFIYKENQWISPKGSVIV